MVKRIIPAVASTNAVIAGMFRAGSTHCASVFLSLSTCIHSKTQECVHLILRIQWTYFAAILRSVFSVLTLKNDLLLRDQMYISRNRGPHFPMSLKKSEDFAHTSSMNFIVHEDTGDLRWALVQGMDIYLEDRS